MAAGVVLRWLLGPVLAATGTAALAQGCPETDPEAMALLEALAGRAGAVSYEGVLTLQRGNSLRMMALRHRVEGDVVSEDLTLLTGQEAQVVRGDHPLDCDAPGQRLLRAAAPEQGDCGLAGHYRISTAPGERVAGRRAVRLLLQPRDMYRYGYVFELDRESAVLLKGTVLGAGGRPLEQFQFASVNIGEDAPAASERPAAAVVHRAAHAHPAAPQAGPEAGLGWAPGWLPAGFVATDEAAARSVRRSYTDGMATFSVFVERLGEPLRPGEGVVREGSTVSYTRGLTLGPDPVLITVLGEIPVNTARMVADAVQRVR
jgi:sigma-E factor negative regulatory protein RseB